VLIGGAPGPKLFAHVAEYADGWLPIGGAGIRDALPELRRAFEARGRDPATLHVVPMGVLPDEAKLEYYASIGVTEVVLRLPSAPRDAVMPVLDTYARFV
jgi:alkanesulfonate monooxygenase SsuD/methylene tetrahydromethanopterin reductase-like flavin-dependent oxidoreductase (luciferase family)